MVKKKDLEKEIDKLNEILAKKGHNRQKTSTFFLLLNSNDTPKNQTEVESSMEYMKEIVQSIGENLDNLIEFKDKSHSYSTQYIDDVKIKFSLEQGLGRKKKNGEYSEHAGQVHAHALLTVKHKSNITIDRDKLQEFAQEKFNYYYGHNGFAGVKWVPDDALENYMTKSKRYAEGYEWKKIQ